MSYTADERLAFARQKRDEQERLCRAQEMLPHVLGALLASNDLRLDKDGWETRCDRLIEQAKHISAKASE